MEPFGTDSSYTKIAKTYDSFAFLLTSKETFRRTANNAHKKFLNNHSNGPHIVRVSVGV